MSITKIATITRSRVREATSWTFRGTMMTQIGYQRIVKCISIMKLEVGSNSEVGTTLS